MTTVVVATCMTIASAGAQSACRRARDGHSAIRETRIVIAPATNHAADGFDLIEFAAPRAGFERFSEEPQTR
jgi:hypothetical protein